MNTLRRFSGIIWMLLGPIAIFILLKAVFKILQIADTKINAAVDETTKLAAESAKSNTMLQWAIMIAIFIPIMVGLVIFGYYAFKGEYDRNE